MPRAPFERSWVMDPVSVHVGDLVIVFLTVLVVGWAAVWWPVRYLSRRLL